MIPQESGPLDEQIQYYEKDAGVSLFVGWLVGVLGAGTVCRPAGRCHTGPYHGRESRPK